MIADLIKTTLKRGGRWKVEQLVKRITSDYGMFFYGEQIEEQLQVMMRKWLVLSAPVLTKEEKPVFEYWWSKKRKEGRGLVTVAQLIVKIDRAEKTFPFDHPEREKILKQRKELETIKDKENEYV